MFHIIEIRHMIFPSLSLLLCRSDDPGVKDFRLQRKQEKPDRPKVKQKQFLQPEIVIQGSVQQKLANRQKQVLKVESREVNPNPRLCDHYAAVWQSWNY